MSIYKYCPPERIDIIRNTSIRFTQASVFNDPFESRPNITIDPKDFFSNSYAGVMIRKMMEEELEKRIEMIPSEFRDPQKIEEIKKSLFRLHPEMVLKAKNEFRKRLPDVTSIFHSEFNKQVGILSLTKTSTSLLMWAHYAQGHQGFLIEFDDKHAFFNDSEAPKAKLRNLRPVMYAKVRPTATLSKAKDMDILLAKSLEWEYEQEWRILRPLIESCDWRQGDIYLFSLPKECIRSITFGARMDPEVQKEFTMLVSRQSPHVKLKKATVSKTHFKIEYAPL